MTAEVIDRRVDNRPFIVLLCASVFVAPLLESVLEVGLVRQGVFVLAFVVLLVSAIARQDLLLDRLQLPQAVYSYIGLLLLAVSHFFWFSMYNAISYYGLLIAAAVFVLDFKFFVRIAEVVLWVCLFMGAYEYFSRTFFFVSTRVIGGDVVELNELLFGAGTDLFRSKALFDGPLSLGRFALGLSLICNRSAGIALVAFVLCFLSGFRLGLVAIAPLLFYQLFVLKTGPRQVGRTLYLTGVVALAGLGLALSIDIGQVLSGASIDRITSIFDFETGSHQQRVYYWIEGLRQFGDYDMVHMLLGNNGLFFETYYNNPESGWICLLTDNGLFGLTFYALPILYLGLMALHKRMYYEVVLLGIVCGAMLVQTFHLSLAGNLFYWLIVYYLFQKVQFEEDALATAVEDG